MSRIAIRYAKALFSLAEDEKKLDTVAADLDELQQLLDSNIDFSTFVKNPLVSGLKKADILKNMFSEKLDSLTMKFLYLLSDKKRVNVLDQILLKFKGLMMKHRNQIIAEVSSSSALEDKQLNAIRTNIEAMTQKNVLLQTKADASLIGGFTIKIDDIIVDNSVRYQLSKLKEKLIS